MHSARKLVLSAALGESSPLWLGHPCDRSNIFPAVLNLATADSSTRPAVSNLYISDAQVTIAINLPPNSNDLNFYIQSPTWYSYFALGIGSEMANSLMLVVYSAADNQRMTTNLRLHLGFPGG